MKRERIILSKSFERFPVKTTKIFKFFHFFQSDSIKLIKLNDPYTGFCESYTGFKSLILGFETAILGFGALYWVLRALYWVLIPIFDY